MNDLCNFPVALSAAEVGDDDDNRDEMMLPHLVFCGDEQIFESDVEILPGVVSDICETLCDDQILNSAVNVDDYYTPHVGESPVGPDAAHFFDAELDDVFLTHVCTF